MKNKRPQILSADEAIKSLKKGGRIFIDGGAATPFALTKALARNAEQFADNELFHLLSLGDLELASPEYYNKFRDNSFFIGANVRERVQEGNADYTPIFLSEIPRLIRSNAFPVSAALVMVSPPDKNGMCSLGVSVDVALAAVESADIIIAQINKHMPRTFGQSFIPYNSFDYVVEEDHPLPEHAPIVLDEVAQKIGRNVARLIQDGSVLQLGIGGIPDAVLNNLREKNDLGIHTEMFSDGVVDLMKNGNVTNKTKKIIRGRTLSGLCFGTKKLYDYIHENPLIVFYPSDFVNDPFVISQNDNMISVNSALQVDLTGQVCADSMGAKFYSGIGGQVDFVRGASRSKGGKSIIALPSTAKGGSISRIVGELTQGAGVVTSRGDVHYVITEYGVAYLHGKTIRQRAIELIHIAHPKFRDELMEFVKSNRYVYFDQKTFNKEDQYSANWEEDYIFEEKTYTSRPIKITDGKSLQEFFYSLGDETRYQRFYQIVDSMPDEMAQRFVDVDYKDNMAFVVLENEDIGSKMVAVGRYSANKSGNFIDLTFVVQDDYRKLGIGHYLCRKLIEYAKTKNHLHIKAKSFKNNKGIFKIFNDLRDEFLELNTYVKDDFVYFDIKLKKD
ncbi:MAG: acetyl-CoA hydrolase [Epsilonproteobacteria bacterium]|nr:MAG: acetyl-CoA hydrolase [Campylobacterota bacterium]RLA64915.1 MAG: acetyl-CoA hydrolase [Campylobacterota bacterium]